MDPTEQHAHEPDASFDGGDLDCGGGLLLLIRRHIDPLERGGLLMPNDLADYLPEWTQPISARYQNLEVQAFPPNTQGVTLLQELALLQQVDADLAALGHNSADYLHTVSEAIRLAFADRDREVADPAAMRVSVDELLDPARIRELASTIDPVGRAPMVHVEPAEDHPNTVYVIAVDQYGNVVSLIQSLFATFGSGLVVPDTGIVLHNRGSLFRFDEDHPNACAPRLRRRGDGSLAIEDRVPQEVRDALAARGYTVHARSGWTAEFGGAQAVLVDQIAGRRQAGADRRREGWAVAY